VVPFTSIASTAAQPIGPLAGALGPGGGALAAGAATTPAAVAGAPPAGLGEPAQAMNAAATIVATMEIEIRFALFMCRRLVAGILAEFG
jgi:hypothetical protein